MKWAGMVDCWRLMEERELWVMAPGPLAHMNFTSPISSIVFVRHACSIFFINKEKTSKRFEFTFFLINE